MKSDAFTLSDGYRLEAESVCVPLETARDILSGRRQHHYTCAIRRDGALAVLTRHVLTCPNCGLRRSATARFLAEPIPRLPRPDIHRWVYGQLSLWADEGFLPLHTPVIPSEFTCPLCGETSAPAQAVTHVRLTVTKHKLLLYCRGMFRGIPFSEALELNLRRGRGILTQYPLREGSPRIRDVTQQPELFRQSRIYRLLDSNLRLRKCLYRRLRDLWGQGQLPYPLEQMCPELFLVLVRFIRQPRSFYDAIPWCDGWQLHPHFSGIARTLHDGKKCSRFLDTWKPLGEFRSVRRLFTAQPGLLFYHREAAVLWDALGHDPGSFCNLLRGSHGCWLLSQLAAYPGMRTFLEAYLRLRGQAALALQLEKSQGMVRYYALEYHAMSPARRLLEQQAWQAGNTEFMPGPGFSMPLRLPPSRADGRSGRYRFRYLRSTGEIRQWGRFLGSFLEIFPEGTVVAITRGTQWVGAAQIMEDQVVHTQGAANAPLPVEARQALEAWCKANGLHFPEEGEAFLPF